jgi:3-keto-5-aminohexanoate cleavage enzyme
VNTIGPTEPVATGQDNPRLLAQPHELAFAVAAAYDAGAAGRPYTLSRSGRRP